MSDRIHYSGALQWTTGKTTTSISAGYTACCSGDRARNIRRVGYSTRNAKDVTCLLCIRNLKKAGVL